MFEVFNKQQIRSLWRSYSKNFEKDNYFNKMRAVLLLIVVRKYSFVKEDHTSCSYSGVYNLQLELYVANIVRVYGIHL